MDTRIGRYPRVLVLTRYPFNQLDGGGIQLINYFSRWPQDHLAQLYFWQAVAPRDESVCRRFYVLGPREIRRHWLHGLYDQYRWVRHNAIVLGNRMAQAGRGAAQTANRCGFTRWMNKSLERLGLSYAAKGTLSRELEEFIDAFAPDVLFTTLGDIANVRLSRAITDRFSIPIAVHLNDDWMADQYSVGPYSLIMRRRLDEELKALLERAAQRWTVSDMMSEAMGTRYGVPFETLPASVNCAQWRCARQEPIDKRVLTVVYAGTIFEFAQKSSLQDVSDAVAQLNDQGLAAQLRIYAPAAHMADYPSYFKAASTRVVPYRSRDELLRLINGADLLVIPVNFDSESRRFIGYSMPGKVSAYMATGIPILVYGPPDVPPVHEAVSYQYACVVQERDPDALRSALLTMLTDRELRSRFSSVALGRAADFYDESIVCENFRQALARICRPASCV